MRRVALLAVFGFLIGASLRAGGEEEDWELDKKLQELQEEAARAQLPARAGEIPLRGKGGHQFAIFPVGDLTAGLPDFIPPVDGSRRREDSEYPRFGALAEEMPQPFGTAEEVLELTRSSVHPQAWDDPAFTAIQGSRLLAGNSVLVLRDVGRFLDGLRAIAHRSVTVEADVIDVSPALYRQLSGGEGTGLSGVQRNALDQALAQSQARRVVALRGTGLVRQRFYVWHGRQVALLPEFEVEVNTEASIWDPVVSVFQSGALLDVRATVGDEADRVHLEAEVRLDELARPVETRETTAAGKIDQPAVDGVAFRATITLADRAWALLGAGVRHGDRVRIAVVRATVLARAEAGR